MAGHRAAYAKHSARGRPWTRSRLRTTLNVSASALAVDRHSLAVAAALLLAVGLAARPDTHDVMTALNLRHDHYSNKRYTLLPLGRSQGYARTAEVAAIIRQPSVDGILARRCGVFVSDFRAEAADARGALRDLEQRYRLEAVPETGGALRRLHQ